jgi:hypothetical protein
MPANLRLPPERDAISTEREVMARARDTTTVDSSPAQRAPAHERATLSGPQRAMQRLGPAETTSQLHREE